jgi:formylmethanofuran dehydrogenase subunit C
MGKVYKASQINDREKVQKLKEGDIVVHGEFRVEVTQITCAMGGDMCVEGIVKSWLSNHQYKVYFGESVFWGPQRLVKGDLYDYLNARNIVEKK